MLMHLLGKTYVLEIYKFCNDAYVVILFAGTVGRRVRNLLCVLIVGQVVFSHY